MEKMNESIIRRLSCPDHPVDVVLDTDAYNEVDDQFALAYLLRSSDKLRVKRIYAAPFFNARSNSPKDGMERSYAEILHILKLAGCEELSGQVKKGSEQYLPDEHTPVVSEAVRDLCGLAMGYTQENPLYIVAIGAITNIASALLMKPEIADRIVVVWLGGNALDWPEAREFNLIQDVAAARVVFGCKTAVVQLPCMGVVSEFYTTKPELEYWLRGRNALCDYLADITEASMADLGDTVWSRIIWDVTAVGYLVDESFMAARLEPCPVPEYDGQYGIGKTRHLYGYVYHIYRDKLFRDLFAKLAKGTHLK